jgi:hypothetical protein
MTMDKLAAFISNAQIAMAKERGSLSSREHGQQSAASIG